VIQLEPENYMAYSNRGNTHYFLFQNEDSVTDCDQALRLNLQYSFAYKVRAAAHNRLERYDEAIADANEALRFNSQDSFAYAYRGNAYYFKEQYDKARIDYENAILLYDGNYFANMGMYSLFNYILQEYDNALTNLDKAIQFSPYQYDKHSLLNSRAFLYFYLGRYDEAMADINRAIGLEYFDSYINTRGTIYRAMGNYGKAIEDYSNAIRISPNKSVFWMNRAIAHLLSGNQSSYEADRDRAVQLDSENAASAWIDIGKNQLQAGLFDKAAESFNAALKIYPESDKAKKLLTKARARKK